MATLDPNFTGSALSGSGVDPLVTSQISPVDNLTVTIPDGGIGSSNKFLIETNQVNDGAIDGVEIRTNVTQTAAASQWFRVSNNGVDILTIGRIASLNGALFANWIFVDDIISDTSGTIQLGSLGFFLVTGVPLMVTTTSVPTFLLKSFTADGASAVAYEYDTNSALSTAGAIHSQWTNGGVVNMTLDKDGNLRLLTDSQVYKVGTLTVVGSRKVGWGAPTGTATRTTFATGSVTLVQLAERVKALIDDHTAHGLIGA